MKCARCNGSQIVAGRNEYETERCPDCKDDSGGWIQTFTGRRFYPLAPRPEDVDIEDIAHALANLCRFAGHTRRFYSVAEHSVRVAAILKASCPGFPKLHLGGLLHDASEAYLVDVPRPVKHAPDLAGYRAAEAKVEAAIAERFDFADGFSARPWIKSADDLCLRWEAHELMAGGPRHAWAGEKPRIVWPDSSFPPSKAWREPGWSPFQARFAFLETFRALGVA